MGVVATHKTATPKWGLFIRRGHPTRQWLPTPPGSAPLPRQAPAPGQAPLPRQAQAGLRFSRLHLILVALTAVRVHKGFDRDLHADHIGVREITLARLSDLTIRDDQANLTISALIQNLDHPGLMRKNLRILLHLNLVVAHLDVLLAVDQLQNLGVAQFQEGKGLRDRVVVLDHTDSVAAPRLNLIGVAVISFRYTIFADKASRDETRDLKVSISARQQRRILNQVSDPQPTRAIGNTNQNVLSITQCHNFPLSGINTFSLLPAAIRPKIDNGRDLHLAAGNSPARKPPARNEYPHYMFSYPHYP